MSGDGLTVDMSELLELATDLHKTSEHLPSYLRKAVEVSARNVKDTAVKKVGSRKVLDVAAGAIDYELDGFSGDVSGISAEVGYNKDREAGPLGNLIEYGAPRAKKHFLVTKNGKTRNVPVPGGPSKPLPPGRELQTSLEETTTDFEAGVAMAVDDAMKASQL